MTKILYYFYYLKLEILENFETLKNLGTLAHMLNKIVFYTLRFLKIRMISDATISDFKLKLYFIQSNMSNAAKYYDILATSLSILHNYFNGPTKLFLDLCPANFLDISANRSFRVLNSAKSFQDLLAFLEF